MTLNDVELSALAAWVGVHALLLSVILVRRTFERFTGV